MPRLELTLLHSASADGYNVRWLMSDAMRWHGLKYFRCTALLQNRSGRKRSQLAGRSTSKRTGAGYVYVSKINRER